MLTRRQTLAAGIGAGALLAGARPGFAQAGEIVIGGSIPLTGVFAFAGVGVNDGIADYVKIVNEAGGVAGRRVRYIPEDTAYKVDQSVAIFKKIMANNKPPVILTGAAQSCSSTSGCRTVRR